jgi:hypothetical protein
LISAPDRAIQDRNLQVDRTIMAEEQELDQIPPAPRSLKSIKGARMELVRLYSMTKSGQIDPFVAGKLVSILSLLISSARDHDLDERISGIEARLAEVKPNGSARRDSHGRRL